MELIQCATTISKVIFILMVAKHYDGYESVVYIKYFRYIKSC